MDMGRDENQWDAVGVGARRVEVGIGKRVEGLEGRGGRGTDVSAKRTGKARAAAPAGTAGTAMMDGVDGASDGQSTTTALLEKTPGPCTGEWARKRRRRSIFKLNCTRAKVARTHATIV